MIQKNQREMPLLTSFLEPFSCSDLSCLCWSLLTSIQLRSMSDTVWWSKNKKWSSLVCTQTQSRFSFWYMWEKLLPELFLCKQCGQRLITQKYAQMHMRANTVYLSLILLFSVEQPSAVPGFNQTRSSKNASYNRSQLSPQRESATNRITEEQRGTGVKVLQSQNKLTLLSDNGGAQGTDKKKKHECQKMTQCPI